MRHPIGLFRGLRIREDAALVFRAVFFDLDRPGHDVGAVGGRRLRRRRRDGLRHRWLRGIAFPGAPEQRGTYNRKDHYTRSSADVHRNLGFFDITERWRSGSLSALRPSGRGR